MLQTIEEKAKIFPWLTVNHGTVTSVVVIRIIDKNCMVSFLVPMIGLSVVVISCFAAHSFSADENAIIKGVKQREICQSLKKWISVYDSVPLFNDATKCALG